MDHWLFTQGNKNIARGSRPYTVEIIGNYREVNLYTVQIRQRVPSVSLIQRVSILFMTDTASVV
jgi:hypothetical protein